MSAGNVAVPAVGYPLECPVPSDVPVLLRECLRDLERGPQGIPLARYRHQSLAGSRAGAWLHSGLQYSCFMSCAASEGEDGEERTFSSGRF